MTFSVFVSSEINPDWKSRVIMLFTRAKFSHAGILIDNTIYHATKIGVHTTPLAEFMSEHTLPHSVDVTKYIPDLSFAKGWCEGQIGKDYSETQLPGTILSGLRLGDGRREMICSELTARFLTECTNIDVFKGLDHDFIDPVLFINSVLRFVELSR